MIYRESVRPHGSGGVVRVVGLTPVGKAFCIIGISQPSVADLKFTKVTFKINNIPQLNMT